MEQLSYNVRHIANMLHNLADSIQATGKDELIESRYKLLYTLATYQNKWQKDALSISINALQTKLCKAQDDLETSNIVIRTQARTIQDKERVINDMEDYHNEIVEGYKSDLADERMRYNELLAEYKKKGEQLATLETKLHNLQANQTAMIKNAEAKKDCEINGLKQKLLEAKNEISTLKDCEAYDKGRIKRQADKTNYWMDRTKKAEDELAMYKSTYENIMLLPDGVKCPWENAKIIDQHYFDAEGKRYTLWGRGVLLYLGYCTEKRG